MSRSKHNYLAWAEIDLAAVRHNFKAIRLLARKHYKKKGVSPKKKYPQLLGVIKADAYGHGMIKLASVLNTLGIDFFGVSDIAEGIVLRKNGVKKPIILFETTLPSCAKDIVDYNLTSTVCTAALASSLNSYARSKNRVIDIHIKVDTGMGRLGVWCSEAHSFIRHIMSFSHLSIKGIYTHFPMADTNRQFTLNQIKQLYNLVKSLEKEIGSVPYIHAANSMGIAGYTTDFLSVARPGLMLYGLYPTMKVRQTISLKPVMSVKAKIIFIKHFTKGQGISYSHTFTAKKNMTVATLPVGYSDGYLRSLSNKSSVLINGVRCPVVGNVTMDQIMVDVSKVKQVRLGMDATLIGSQKHSRISADELAQYADTINYEIVCSLGNRLPRVYKN